MDSPERILEALSAIEGATRDASRNACTTLEDEISAGEFPLIDDAFIETSLVETIDALPQWAILAHFTVDGARRPPNRPVLNSYVKLMEWARPTKDAAAPNQETTWALINYWRPFN